jgi:hypothetical protein
MDDYKFIYITKLKKKTLLHKVTHLGGVTQFKSPSTCHGGSMEIQNPSMDRGDQILYITKLKKKPYFTR